MNEKLNALIDSYRDELTAMLARWIRTPSVKADPADGAPFGQDVANMLEVAAADLRAMGLPVRTFDGYALDATLGPEDQEMIAVLGHLDVVPVGEGWNDPPFGAVIRGDMMYGRGTQDDKGPVLAALFAMKALKDAGVPMKRSVRLILGGDEESGWEDMAYYCTHAVMPDMGFSPDASFPLINTEKGMIHMLGRAPAAKDGLQVLRMHNGERMNVIPGEASCVVAGGAELVERVKAFARSSGLTVEATAVADGVRIDAHGIGGHSAYPEHCRNANGMLLLTLKALGVRGPLAELVDAYPMEYDGKALGIACCDEISGPLTCNVGILHLDDGVITASFDCRCPVCADLPGIERSIRAHLPSFTMECNELKQPHHVPADSELVTKLLAAYESVTGLKGEAQSTGGGTYAKVLKSGVAFGAVFPDEVELAHQPNECVSISSLLRAAKVYADALLRLCCE